MKKEISFEIKRYTMMIIACLLYAVSLNCFLIPNQIVAGGISGLSTLLNRYIKIDVGWIMLICNVPILLVCLKQEGIKFTINCLITTATLSLVTVFTKYIPTVEKFDFTGDNNIDIKLLSAVFGGLIQGIAIGIFCKYRVSSGGTELLGRFLHNGLKILSIPVFTALIDGIIVITGAICLRSIANVFYALIVIFITTKVSDLIIIGINKSKLCYIITEKPDLIGDFLIAHSPRGVTKIEGLGMYTKQPRGVLLTVVKANQVLELRQFVSSLDSKAFVIVSDTSEVLGNGFKAIKTEDMLAHERNIK